MSSKELTERVADLTMQELKDLIRHMLAQNLYEEAMLVQFNEADPRTLAEVYADIDRNIWTPPPGTPSTTELLRQDRDR